MIRYNRIIDKNPREIVLLKSRPCQWGRCFFCDYINDNSQDSKKIIEFNKEIIKSITGEFNKVEIINSASVFDLPKETLMDIKDMVSGKNIHTLFFESHFMYKNRLEEIRNMFPDTQIIFKCGIETFDNDFRNNYLQKGAYFETYKDVTPYFNSICLMVGIKGQTKDMIRKDMEIAENHFDHVCINIYTKNSTPVEPNNNLINWFKDEYSYLEENDNIEILWNNTDFGVGD